MKKFNNTLFGRKYKLIIQHVVICGNERSYAKYVPKGNSTGNVEGKNSRDFNFQVSTFNLQREMSKGFQFPIFKKTKGPNCLLQISVCVYICIMKTGTNNGLGSSS
jgi:hypothetical protein